MPHRRLLEDEVISLHVDTGKSSDDNTYTSRSIPSIVVVGNDSTNSYTQSGTSDMNDSTLSLLHDDFDEVAESFLLNDTNKALPTVRRGSSDYRPSPPERKTSQSSFDKMSLLHSSLLNGSTHHVGNRMIDMANSFLSHEFLPPPMPLRQLTSSFTDDSFPKITRNEARESQTISCKSRPLCHRDFVNLSRNMKLSRDKSFASDDFADLAPPSLPQRQETSSSVAIIHRMKRCGSSDSMDSKLCNGALSPPCCLNRNDNGYSRHNEKC